MRLICASLASVFVLSCGSSAPTQPTATSPPAPGGPPQPPVNTYLVAGTVRDDRGAPIEGAQVYGGALYSKTGPLFGSTTDAAGRYSGRLPYGTWQLSVSKPGFVRYTSSSFSLTADTTVDVTLKPGVNIRGTILEEGVGPLAGARVEVLTGPNAGENTVTGGPGVPGTYGLHVLPGEFRIRASKDGYEPVEQTVRAFTDTTVDFTLKWAYGSCLRSVTPVIFNGYPSAGGDETIVVDAYPDRDWTATVDQPWLSVLSPAANDGPGRVTFRVLPHPPGAEEARTGAIMIRCGAAAGQNVWVVQNPDCQIRLTPHADTPEEFPASGGTGKLRVVTGPARCRWKAEPRADWLSTVGVSSWYASFDNLHFIVSENRSGAPRSGVLMVGETAWVVKQR